VQQQQRPTATQTNNKRNAVKKKRGMQYVFLNPDPCHKKKRGMQYDDAMRIDSLKLEKLEILKNFILNLFLVKIF
jgi:hypothetical protein